jgi:hypothetical protein
MQGWGDEWEEDGGRKRQRWVSPETLHGVVSMMAVTLLSLKGHFCPSFTPKREKITSADAKIA